MGILNRIDLPVAEQETASRYIDLNMNTIAEAVSECWGSNVSGFYEVFPADSEAEKYRRDIFCEIEELGLYDGLYSAYELNGRVLALSEERNKMAKRRQNMLALAHEVRMYCRAADELMTLLEGKLLKSGGLVWFRTKLSEYTGSSVYIAMRDKAYELCRALDGLKVTFVYGEGKIQITVSEGEPIAEDNRLNSPFKDFGDICGLEQAMLVYIGEKRPDIFGQLKEFFENYNTYRADWLMQFYDEIVFYLSYMKFEKHMSSQGFCFTMASVDESVPMKAEGLYDLALAIENIKRNRPVVDNDFIYEDEERFFVLTGPNQGGKTTFARSLGQLVYLTKLGVKAPAVCANIHYFDDLLTHFSVEESVETGRGKLMEELVRLKPMMNMPGRHFVVINELFTTAANYDAVIMGRRVLQYFIENGCYGIYVTHLTELLEGTDRAVGLCAQLNENGVQTYRILRRVMEYNNAAAAQVRKYRLGYDELSARLAGKENI